MLSYKRVLLAWVLPCLLSGVASIPCAASAQDLSESVLATGGGIQTAPTSLLTQGKSGDFYGVARGYYAASGSVFSLSCDGKAYATIYPFANKEVLGAGVIEGASGDLYGVIHTGPADLAYGAVFRLTKQGKLSFLHKFSNADGAHPAGPLLEAPDGTLYGTTFQGGDDSTAGLGFGVVYKIDPTGAFSTVYDFGVDDGVGSGANPSSSLALAPDGTLYGTTEALGQYGGGTVYKVGANGAFQVIAAFGGSTGARPHDLVRSPSGTLYGRALAGQGLIFELPMSGALGPLHALTAQEGTFDVYNTRVVTYGGALALAADGALYGVAGIGGANGKGTVFKVLSTGQLTVLYNFKGSSDGGIPVGVMLGADGNLYGTYAAGAGGIYKILLPGAVPKATCAASSMLDAGVAPDAAVEFNALDAATSQSPGPQDGAAKGPTTDAAAAGTGADATASDVPAIQTADAALPGPAAEGKQSSGCALGVVGGGAGAPWYVLALTWLVRSGRRSRRARQLPRYA